MLQFGSEQIQIGNILALISAACSGMAVGMRRRVGHTPPCAPEQVSEGRIIRLEERANRVDDAILSTHKSVSKIAEDVAYLRGREASWCSRAPVCKVRNNG